MAETGKTGEVQPEERRAFHQAEDERLNFLSPSFDPLLLLQQRPAAAAAGGEAAAAAVALPNIRLGELLLPWGHQPQSIAAAAAAAAGVSGEDTVAASAAPGTQPSVGERTKRSAFEARLNAAKNKQLRIGGLLPSRLGHFYIEDNAAAAVSASAFAAACAAAGAAAACGNPLKQQISRLRSWQQQNQELEALVHPRALLLLQHCCQPDPTCSSSNERCWSSSSQKSIRVRGYLRWFDVNMTLVLQPAEIIDDSAQQRQHEQQQQQGQQQQQWGRRVDWLLIP
ncbi:hypothetical protein ACSSS7_007188 [Eimeria intestinalis]